MDHLIVAVIFMSFPQSLGFATDTPAQDRLRQATQLISEEKFEAARQILEAMLAASEHPPPETYYQLTLCYLRATRGSWRHVPTGSCYFHASEAHANLAAKEELLLRSFRIEIQDELGKGPQNCLSTRGWAPDYRSGSWLMKSEVTLEKVSRNRCMPALGSLSRWNSSFSFESGGSNTIYSIAALDERVRLTRAVSSVTNFDYWIRNNRSRN